MKKFQAILVSTCFLFILISCVRLLIHILTNDIRTTMDFIGLTPVLLFIVFLFYLGGSLCLEIVRESFSGQRHLK